MMAPLRTSGIMTANQSAVLGWPILAVEETEIVFPARLCVRTAALEAPAAQELRPYQTSSMVIQQKDMTGGRGQN